jgi:hypothetical protein
VPGIQLTSIIKKTQPPVRRSILPLLKACSSIMFKVADEVVGCSSRRGKDWNDGDGGGQRQVPSLLSHARRTVATALPAPGPVANQPVIWRRSLLSKGMGGGTRTLYGRNQNLRVTVPIFG